MGLSPLTDFTMRPAGYSALTARGVLLWRYFRMAEKLLGWKPNSQPLPSSVVNVLDRMSL